MAFYTPLTDDEYNDRFGISSDGVTDDKKLKAAYKKAWEVRNFEIDKLWTRAAYYWGFLVAIFAGYIAVMTSENNRQALTMHLDLYLILLGLIFSVAWLLIQKASKRLQVNWEAHIDRFEEYISGPLYKTIFCTSKTFYSITDVNEVLAYVVIGVWVMLLIQYLSQKCLDCMTVVSLVMTGIVLVILLTRRTGKSGYQTEIRPGHNGEFIDRTSERG
jgi:hypothetical protein